MHQTVLVHADVDESAERGDVGDGALEDHALLEILDLLDAVLEHRRLERRTRVAAGLFQFAQDVGDGRQTKGVVDEGLRLQPAHHLGVADQRLDIAFGRLEDAAHHRIGFRMHAGRIERIVAIGDAEEAGTLLERLRPEPRHVLERLARLERAVGVAVLHDALRQPLADA